ncbi:MAG: helix-turn-helix domain-containing protein [Gammaproteobacteria bacterium]
METHAPHLAYSIREAQKLTSLSRTTLWRAMKAGKLRTTKCGARRLIPSDELIAFIAATQALGADNHPAPPISWLSQVVLVTPPDRPAPLPIERAE